MNTMLKRTIAGALLSGGVAMAGSGLAAGTAEADSGYGTGCQGNPCRCRISSSGRRMAG